MSSGFSADPDALRAQAGRLLDASADMARLVGSLGGAGEAATGDSALDGLIARLVDEVKSSAGGAGMALEAAGERLVVNAASYAAADHASSLRPTGP